MLELDDMLMTFLHQGYPGLSATDKQSFESLLEEEDQELFDWLMGKGKPEDDLLYELVSKIRTHLIETAARAT